MSARKEWLAGWRAKNRLRIRQQGRNWNARHPDRLREGRLRQKYGISVAQWESLFDSQGRVCAICKRDTVVGQGWHVDHDHSCCAGAKSCGACVRGILCQGCNIALGGFGDKIVALVAAIEYLKRGGSNGGERQRRGDS